MVYHSPQTGEHEYSHRVCTPCPDRRGQWDQCYRKLESQQAEAVWLELHQGMEKRETCSDQGVVW
ncbi:hypothetical protein Q5E86_18230 [Providencia sp. CRE-138-0111]|uniref:Uncharacterized protein n=1 Tax=Providencia huashanensis TaxID=3037798 RepID=A0ABT9AU99_9GAMM|nr:MULTISPECIES: hypothetical protein [Providencia]MDO7858240.1 hypothetical protein [Providencia sp. CRE-138-0111]